MKKIYTLIALIMCVGGLSAQNTVVIANFEDGTHPFTSFWSTEGTVVDNPNTSGNSSSKVLEFAPEGWSNGAGLWQDDGKFFLENYITYKVDIYVPVGKLPTNDNALTVKLQGDNSVSGNANLEMYRNVTTEGQWVTLEYDLTNMQYHDYKQFGIQAEGLEGGSGNIYIDNVVFIQDLTLSVNEQIQFNTQNIFNKEGSINIQNCMGSNVAIYSLSGAKVFSQDNAGGNLSVNVVPGLYIVVVDNTSKKVVVK